MPPWSLLSRCLLDGEAYAGALRLHDSFRRQREGRRLRNESYSEHLAVSRKDEFLLNAYVLAARDGQLAHEWTLYRDHKPVRHILEEGDKGKGMQRRVTA